MSISNTPQDEQNKVPLAAPQLAGLDVLYRVKQVLQIIPISRSSWYAGVKAGRFPKGQKLSAGITVWHSQEIDAIVTAMRQSNASET